MNCLLTILKHFIFLPLLYHLVMQLRYCSFQVVKMFLIIVVVFGVCWLPYHVYFIYYYHDKSIVKFKYISQIFLGFYWLAMANTMVNPIIYYWMNTRYVFGNSILSFLLFRFLFLSKLNVIT